MSKLKIAIQKSGRLKNDSLALLKSCGISIDNGKDQLKASARNFPLEVFYLRNSDIPQYVADGVADIAILGENTLIEKQKRVEIIQKLGFSKCRVSLAIPKGENYSDARFFNGKKIATSYPKTLQAFFNEKNIDAKIHLITGSVEIAPNIGLADGIFDIVSTGSTLFKNGLKEVETVLNSEAVLTSTPNLPSEKQAILDKLLFRISAVLEARNNKYILMNVPNDKIEIVANLLPVLRSPTVLPLATEGWSSLHSVISKKNYWEVIDQLKAAGAEGILVTPIETMIR